MTDSKESCVFATGGLLAPYLGHRRPSYGYFKPSFDWVLNLPVCSSSKSHLVAVFTDEKSSPKVIKIRTLYVSLECPGLLAEPVDSGFRTVSIKEDKKSAKINGLFKHGKDYFYDEYLKKTSDADHLRDHLKLDQRDATIVGIEETEAELVVYLLAQGPEDRTNYDPYRQRFMAQLGVPARILYSYDKLFNGEFPIYDSIKGAIYETRRTDVYVKKNPTYFDWYRLIAGHEHSSNELAKLMLGHADGPHVESLLDIELGAAIWLTAIIKEYSTIIFNEINVSPGELREESPGLFELAERIVKSSINSQPQRRDLTKD